jgi:hypothetical protein
MLYLMTDALRHFVDARTIANMPALSGSGNSGHASTMVIRSGSIDSARCWSAVERAGSLRNSLPELVLTESEHRF